MCLRIIENCKTKIKKDIIAYKHFKVKGGKIFSSYRNTKIYSAGYIKSDRNTKKLTTNERIDGEIHYGCHAFLSLKDAIKDAKDEQKLWNCDYAVLKIKIRKNDFVVAGFFDHSRIKSLVCIGYTIEQEDFDKAIKGIGIIRKKQ
jgi:hypothetical protein